MDIFMFEEVCLLYERMGETYSLLVTSLTKFLAVFDVEFSRATAFFHAGFAAAEALVVDL